MDLSIIKETLTAYGAGFEKLKALGHFERVMEDLDLLELMIGVTYDPSMELYMLQAEASPPPVTLSVHLNAQANPSQVRALFDYATSELQSEITGHIFINNYKAQCGQVPDA
jgi:hypothetical protein